MISIYPKWVKSSQRVVCFDTPLAAGEWGIAGLAIPHSLRRSAWASRTAAQRVGGFPLLATLVYVADEYPAAYAGARTLEASVVSFYGVVLLLKGWVRVGCARLSRCPQSASFLWTGLRGASPPAGPFEKPSLVFECDGGVQFTSASWFTV